ncbi:LOW QUALITY PROTEIN: threonine--tRNA ligase, mitochondrial [Melanerpes formicivorus]|uniref:LOW QUALITY PROTEIN: threonine--tRNA ligase, mitochondrial n=1 Tax=Melanerpes formicivorus TaxID=211600 RepID=UPI00358E34D9
MPVPRAPARLLFAGVPRRHRVSGPDSRLTESLRLFQQLRAEQEQRNAGRTGPVPPPGTPIRITLPGGSSLPGRALQDYPFPGGHGAGVEAALVARVNGTLQDLDQPLASDASLELLDFNTPEGRGAFWRSGACVLGAVAEQFFRATFCSAQATEDGFFCDLHMGDRTVQRGELPALEDACAAFARDRHRFERLEATRRQLRELFQHNSFQLQQIEEDVTSPTATVYRCGPLLHICPGPLLRHTGLISALRVLTGLGAQQQGSGAQQWLQRVAAVAFPSAQLLAAWQQAQDEAALRDHRAHRAGEPQELFFFHKLSPGSCFFLPRGAHIYNTLVEFIRSEYRARGFSEVVTPNLFKPRLWEQSGHWQHYSSNMFTFTAGTETLSLKPMNCPAHCLMFAHRPRSWRELPLRLADFGVLHRHEPPGSLAGLTRVRRFQQDDAHIFCTMEQLEAEIDACLDFIRSVYSVLGFSFRLALATRPPWLPGGTPEAWDRAEQQLERSLRTFGQPWELAPADGAFYGPKIDIRIRDALGRQHQCGTIQLDFQMPERFELEYARIGLRGGGGAPVTPSRCAAARAGAAARPVLIHRAVLGSVERMVAVLAESCGGRWPFWLSPLQAVVIPQAPEVEDYAREVQAVLQGEGILAELDGDLGATLARKIRRAQLAHYNFQLVVGPRERARGTVSVRTRQNRRLGEVELRRLLRRLRELRDGRVPDAEESF